MYKFGERSSNALNSCHPDLIRLANEIIKHVDFAVIEGVRTLDRQTELVRTGKSHTMKSKHLPNEEGLSEAFDIMLCPIDWEGWERNYMFVGFVKGIAASMDIKVRVGADWDGDWSIKDQRLHDLPHVELVLI